MITFLKALRASTPNSKMEGSGFLPGMVKRMPCLLDFLVIADPDSLAYSDWS